MAGGDNGGVASEGGVGAIEGGGGVEVGAGGEEGIVGGAVLEVGLVVEFPAEGVEDWLNKGMLQLVLAVVGEVGGFLFPEGFDAAEDGGGFVAKFGPFGFEAEAVFEPMVGKQLAVADGGEG